VARFVLGCVTLRVLYRCGTMLR